METETRNALREEILNLRESNLNRWLTFTGVAFTLVSVLITGVSIVVYQGATARAAEIMARAAEIRDLDPLVRERTEGKEKELGVVGESPGPSETFEGSLSEGEDEELELVLSPGFHWFAATCQGCEDLDLAIYTSGGDLIEEDTLLDALPIVSHEVTSAETVRVEVRMFDCPGRSCGWEMTRSHFPASSP